MLEHSKIGASSMHRWAKCPGSVRLSDGMPNISSAYAKEGTLAHEFAAKLLMHGHINAPIIPTTEMLEACEFYVDTIKQDGPFDERWVEEKFDLSAIHPGLYGTADAVMYDAHKKILRVYDFKYGAGTLVDAYNNQQLQYYGLGALLSTGVGCEEVELVIIQPRGVSEDKVRRWRFKSIELLDFAADLEEAAIKTEAKDAKLVAGEHCRFCPAAAKCPEVHDTALALAKLDFQVDKPYDSVKLGKALDFIPKFEAWAKMVKEFAHGVANRGEEIEGFKLVDKKATRKWRHCDDTTITTLMSEFDLWEKDCSVYTIKSPAQIEKLLTKEQKIELAELVIKKSTGTTLVPVSDKRQALSVGPQNEFGEVT